MKNYGFLLGGGLTSHTNLPGRTNGNDLKLVMFITYVTKNKIKVSFFCDDVISLVMTPSSVTGRLF